MLNLDAPFPTVLVAALPTAQQVADHSIKVDAGRWRGLLRSLPLPEAGPVFGDADGWIEMSRRDVASLADADISPDNAVQLLYATLAWGLGGKARLLPTRLEQFAKNDAAPELLAGAWESVRAGRDPQECYELLLTPRGRARVSYFGAAFATKYLYFAHGTDHAPRNLILDQVVATRLSPYAWPDAPTSSWWSSTYRRYCDLMGSWARQAGDLQAREVRPDQVEMALFRLTPSA